MEARRVEAVEVWAFSGAFWLLDVWSFTSRIAFRGNGMKSRLIYRRCFISLFCEGFGEV